MDKLSKSIGLVVLGILAICALGLILSLPVMWLWNGSLVPAVAGLHEIGWLQAWGINILCGILFKGSTSTSSS